jgi:hypothetical protein
MEVNAQLLERSYARNPGPRLNRVVEHLIAALHPGDEGDVGNASVAGAAEKRLRCPSVRRLFA